MKNFDFFLRLKNKGIFKIIENLIYIAFKNRFPYIKYLMSF